MPLNERVSFIFWALPTLYTSEFYTDLGSLIGNFDYAYSTVWKSSNFPATLILHEIDFGWFEKVKHCHFNNFEGLEFWFLEKFHTWKCQKLPIMQNEELLKRSKLQFLVLQNYQNWFHVKSGWHKNPEISTLCIPN